LRQSRKLAGERQRPQQDRVDHAEDCGVGANAERERNHGHGGEAGIFHQHSQTIAYILKQLFKSVPSPHISAPFF